MSELERDVQALFIRRVRAIDPQAKTYKADVVAGWPDWFVFWSLLAPWGRGLSMVELKAPTGQLSRLQKAIHKTLESVTGVRPALLYGKSDVQDWSRHHERYHAGYLTPPPPGTILFQVVSQGD